MKQNNGLWMQSAIFQMIHAALEMLTTYRHESTRQCTASLYYSVVTVWEIWTSVSVQTRQMMWAKTNFGSR